MTTTISRLYTDYDTGARVVAELERSGIPHDDISIIANKEGGGFDRDGSRRVDRDADGTPPACLPVSECWRFPALVRSLPQVGWPRLQSWPLPVVLLVD